MLWKRKAWMYSTMLVASLLFIAVDHRGVPFGDHIFRFVGLPPWSNHDQGFHYSSILGIILIFMSGNLVIQHFRKKYKRVARKVVVACILFFILFPAITKGTLTLVHSNHTGLAVLDYSNKNYRCSHTTNDGIVSYHCTIQLFNYGKQVEYVQIKPILDSAEERSIEIPAIEIQYKQIMIRPRSDSTYSITFESKFTDRNTFGSSIRGGVSFRLDGQEKHVHWY